MNKAIELLWECWQQNADEIEYMLSGNPELYCLISENEELQQAIDVLRAIMNIRMGGGIVPFVCDNCKCTEGKELTRSTTQCKKCDHLQTS